MKIVPRIPKYKGLVTLAIAISFWTAWLIILGYQEAISHLINHWEIALTMVFGSIIAGGTSIGGGAVAFPVFTKLLHISPYDAKVFSLAIQSVGMGAASLAVCLTGIRVEWRVIRWGSLGGCLGMFLGFEFFTALFPPDVIKMSFTIMLVTLAMTLFLNKRKRKLHMFLIPWSMRERWLLLLAGLIGGFISSLVGNGIDILLFSVMVLLWNISEKVATPTSVVLMAINALWGFILQVFVFHDFPPLIQDYWLAAIPIVVLGAPVGPVLCSLLSRETIARCLIVLIFIELITSLLLIPLRPMVIYSSAIAFVLFATFNYWMCHTRIYKLPPLSSQ